MADDSLESLRLSLMQDVLPVGMALYDRLKEGGANKVVEAFTSSSDPLEKLRAEGEPAAKSVRKRLDDYSPGLGNPVVSVQVDIDPQHEAGQDLEEQKALMECLTRIELRLQKLEHHLTKDSKDIGSIGVDDGTSK